MKTETRWVRNYGMNLIQDVCTSDSGSKLPRAGTGVSHVLYSISQGLDDVVLFLAVAFYYPAT